MIKSQWQKRAERAEGILNALRYRVTQGKRGNWWWSLVTRHSGQTVARCSPGDRSGSRTEAIAKVHLYFPDLREYGVED